MYHVCSIYYCIYIYIVLWNILPCLFRTPTKNRKLLYRVLVCYFLKYLWIKIHFAAIYFVSFAQILCVKLIYVNRDAGPLNVQTS